MIQFLFVALIVFLLTFAWLRGAYPVDSYLVTFFMTVGIANSILFIAFIAFPYLMGFKRIFWPN